MSIEKHNLNFAGVCDSCGAERILKSTTPLSATQSLRQMGWRRVGFFKGARAWPWRPAFLWHCVKCLEIKK